MIVSIWELLGDTVQGLDLVGRLLGARGRVLPMAAEPLEIVAEIRGHDPARPDDTVEVRGQHRVASSPGHRLVDRHRAHLPRALPRGPRSRRATPTG